MEKEFMAKGQKGQKGQKGGDISEDAIEKKITEY